MTFKLSVNIFSVCMLEIVFSVPLFFFKEFETGEELAAVTEYLVSIGLSVAPWVGAYYNGGYIWRGSGISVDPDLYGNTGPIDMFPSRALYITSSQTSLASSYGGLISTITLVPGFKAICEEFP